MGEQVITCCHRPNTMIKDSKRESKASHENKCLCNDRVVAAATYFNKFWSSLVISDGREPTKSLCSSRSQPTGIGPFCIGRFFSQFCAPSDHRHFVSCFGLYLFLSLAQKAHPSRPCRSHKLTFPLVLFARRCLSIANCKLILIMLITSSTA